MVLWKLSDFLLLLVPVLLVQNFFFAVLFAGRTWIEKKFAMSVTDRILKTVLLYMLTVSPVLAGMIMYRMTYLSARPAPGPYLTGMILRIGNESLSSRTAYGNNWVFALALGLWLAGMLWRGLLPWLRERRLLKKLERNGSEEPGAALAETVQKLTKDMGISRRFQIFESSLILQPFITGFFRQKIFFPAGVSEDEKRELMLRHELYHFRERDGLYRRFLFFLRSLYWFNPLAGSFAFYFTEVNEMACDERVLRDCSVREKVLYAELLAAAGTGEDLFRHAAALTGHTKSSLERRMENMLKTRKYTGKKTFIFLTAALLTACTTVTYAAAAGTSCLQDAALDAFIQDEEETMKTENILEEQTDYEEMLIVRDNENFLGARSVTAVDEVLNGREAVIVGTVSMEAGGKAAFVIWGDNDSDRFRAGYRDSTGKRTYVTALNGEIDHTFTVSKSGTYQFFVEGISEKTIHITGGITIK